jgi:conjugative relaxase-like TrwC/TraI family protein
MIHPEEIKSASDASRYYSDVKRAAEYYAGEAIPNRWSGRAAEQLGLTGSISQRDLEAILEGKHVALMQRRPLDKYGKPTPLGRLKKDGGIEHRKGWDFTISAPKSVSLAALAFGRDDVRDAHRIAVDTALRYLEERAKTRANVTTGNLAIAQYEHVTSRSGDPQLHTHALVANFTVHNGQVRSLDSKSLYNYYSTADRIYHQTLSRELQKAGYEVNHNKLGRVELSDYSREVIREFSKRKEAIDKELVDRGLDREHSSARLRGQIALRTRAKSKNHIETREANIDRWRTQAEAVMMKEPAQRASTHTLSDEIREIEAAGNVVKLALAHLSEREMVFSEKQLHQSIASFNRGRASWDVIDQVIKDLQHWGELIRKGENFATQASVDAETKLEARVAAGRSRHQIVMTDAEFVHALAKFEKRKRFSLNMEQRAAAYLILVGNDRFQGVQGLAGTGKTTMLEFVNEAAVSKGWTVNGMSNGAEQASKLEAESGIRSTTTARHLFMVKQVRAPTDVAAHEAYDAQLAQDALNTWKAEQDRFLPVKLDWKRLSERGEVVHDSLGNRYARLGNGSVYAEKLFGEPKHSKIADGYHVGQDGRTYRLQYLKSNALDRDGVREMGRDGYLASKALASWERERSRLFKSRLNFEKMAEKRGVFFDSNGRRYVRDSKGSIYSEAFFNQRRRDGKYAEGRGGKIFVEEQQKRPLLANKSTYKKATATQSLYAKYRMRLQERESSAVEARRLDDLLQQSLAKKRERGPREMPDDRLFATKNSVVSGAHAMFGRHEIKQLLEEIRKSELARLDRVANTARADGNKVLWVHDEASMSGVKEFSDMTTAAERAGAKVVSLGDQLQHQAVEAGGKTFERLQKHMSMAKLDRDSIRRQKEGSVAEKAVQATLDGKTQKALDAMDKVEIRTAQDMLAKEKPEAEREQRREAARQDNRAVMRQIGRDYAALAPESRKNTIVITGTNADRKAINAEIREAMRDRGQLGEVDRQVVTLKKIGMTEQQKGHALQYQQDDPSREPLIVQARETSKNDRVKAGQQFEVIAVNEHANTLTLRSTTDAQHVVTVDPTKVSLEAYERETRGIADADVIRFTENHDLRVINGGSMKVVNGQFAQVEKVESDRVTLLVHDLANERAQPDRVTVGTSQPLKIDHAATYTSFKAQGQGKDQAWIHHNTETNNHSQREWYVNVTRAKVDGRIYTQDVDKALGQIGIPREKASATEFAKEQLQEERAAIHRIQTKPDPFSEPFDKHKASNDQAADLSAREQRDQHLVGTTDVASKTPSNKKRLDRDERGLSVGR